MAWCYPHFIDLRHFWTEINGLFRVKLYQIGTKIQIFRLLCSLCSTCVDCRRVYLWAFVSAQKTIYDPSFPTVQHISNCLIWHLCPVNIHFILNISKTKLLILNFKPVLSSVTPIFPSVTNPLNLGTILQFFPFAVTFNLPAGPKYPAPFATFHPGC